MPRSRGSRGLRNVEPMIVIDGSDTGERDAMFRTMPLADGVRGGACLPARVFVDSFGTIKLEAGDVTRYRRLYSIGSASLVRGVKGMDGGRLERVAGNVRVRLNVDAGRGGPVTWVPAKTGTPILRDHRRV